VNSFCSRWLQPTDRHRRIRNIRPLSLLQKDRFPRTEAYATTDVTPHRSSFGVHHPTAMDVPDVPEVLLSLHVLLQRGSFHTDDPLVPRTYRRFREITLQSVHRLTITMPLAVLIH